ncbi:hypothetical protein, partial [Pseudomonas syringae]
ASIDDFTEHLFLRQYTRTPQVFATENSILLISHIAHSKLSRIPETPIQAGEQSRQPKLLHYGFSYFFVLRQLFQTLSTIPTTLRCSGGC